MGHPLPATQPQSAPQWWRIGRTSLSFLLDTFGASRGGGDIIDPLLVTAVLDANVAPVAQDSTLSLRYATLEAPPPDDLRRPVSVNAIAASLRMPYETVRRRLTRLAGFGAVTVTPKGVVTPMGTVDNVFYRVVAVAHYERTRRFYFELKALGALADVNPRPAEAPRHESPPVRLANRLLSEYSLRMIDSLMRRIGDPVSGMILLELAKANIEHLDEAELSVEGPLPDSRRMPIRALALAKRVGLPPETVRRHVATLEKGGLCRRVRGGLLAAPEQLGRGEDGSHGVFDNVANLHRLFSRLAQFGVLAYWEDEARAAAKA